MRLNPFAFPSDTTFRFLLFIAAIVGVSLLAFDWIYGVFIDQAAQGQALIDCSRLAPIVDGVPPTDAQQQAFRDCLARVNATNREAILLGIIVLLVGGAVAYGIAVWRLRRRYRPLVRDDAPALVDAVDAMADELGVQPAPGLRWQPLDPRAMGLAFGPPGNRELALTGGLVPLSIRDRPAFRAIVLHELAHLRNGDVDLSYYAIGLWRALLVVAIAPFLLALVRAVIDDPNFVLPLAWRFIVLVPVVYVIRSAILRAREHDADVRASTREPEIRRVLAAAASREPTRSKLSRLVAWHPSAAYRVAVIDDPAPLLRLGLLDVVGIGIVGSLAYDKVALVIGYGGLSAFANHGLAALVFAPLVGIILALGTWRQTFAWLATRRNAVQVVPMGLALVAGLLVGQRLALTSAIVDENVLLRPDPTLFQLGIVLAIAVGAVLFVAWLVAAARLWLPVATRLRSPGWASVPVAVGGAVLLWIAVAAFEIVLGSREVLEPVVGAPDEVFATVQAVVPGVGPEWLWRLVNGLESKLLTGEPLVMTFVALMVLVPWAAAPFHRGLAAHPVATWGSLDGPASAPAIERPELRPRWALGMGLAATIGIGSTMVVLYAATHAGFSDAMRDRDEVFTAFYFWLICITLAWQVAAGAFAAAGAPSFGTLHAALAGLVVAVGGTAVAGLTHAAQGCVPALEVVVGRACGKPPVIDYLTLYVSGPLTIGVVGAALAGASVAGIRWLFAGRQGPTATTSPLRPPPPPPRWLPPTP